MNYKQKTKMAASMEWKKGLNRCGYRGQWIIILENGWMGQESSMVNQKEKISETILEKVLILIKK